MGGQRLQLEHDVSSDTFSLKRGLTPGSYQFKFIVDGEWCVSPDLPTVENNGNVNNVLDVVPEKGSVVSTSITSSKGPGEGSVVPTSIMSSKDPDADRRKRMMA